MGGFVGQPLGGVLVGAICTITMAIGCAARAPVQPPPIAFEQKLSRILMLEDQRILGSTVEPASQGDAAVPAEGAVVATPLDLPALLVDPEAQIRRRAALAMCRVGLAEAIPSLVTALADHEPEVRQMSAFALGLIGDDQAVEPLVATLQDPSPIVRGRAAEALGLIGDPDTAPAVSDMVTVLIAWGAGQPDDAVAPTDPNVQALRLGVNALARLGEFEPLAAAALDDSGQPRIPWWPVAHALRQLSDDRAWEALVSFARWPAGYGAAFAAQALGALGDPRAVEDLLVLLESDNGLVAAAAATSLGRLGDERAGPALLRQLARPDLASTVQVAAVESLAALRHGDAVNVLLDLLSHASPTMRVAALRAVAAVDPQTLMLVLSGLDPDPHWKVRAGLADLLGSVDPEVAAPRLTALLEDPDQRVVASALRSLVRVAPANLEELLLEHLQMDDTVVRMAAADGVGVLRPPGGIDALVAAYERGGADPDHRPRAAALGALALYGTPEALEIVRLGLADKRWAVRLHAAELLGQTDSPTDVHAIRPAPTPWERGFYDQPELVVATVSPHVYLETSKGTLQIELAVLEAPITARHFMDLARNGFFNGLSVYRVGPDAIVELGDPRADGYGGPGLTIKEELNELSFARGTVAMASDGPDAVGSRFFIARAPRPELEARRTAFGRVVAGWDVLDRLEEWDVIERVRVWDGTSTGPMSGEVAPVAR